MARKRVWVWSTLPLLLASVTPQPAAAQRHSIAEHDVLRHSDLRALAEEAEKLSDSFKDRLDRELDHSIIDDTRHESRYEHRAARLEDALDDVRSAVTNDYKFKQARDRVKRALKYAQELDRDLDRLPHSHELEAHWRQLMSRIRDLAYFYEVRPGRS
jgi:hypothetical protein